MKNNFITLVFFASFVCESLNAQSLSQEMITPTKWSVLGGHKISNWILFNTVDTEKKNTLFLSCKKDDKDAIFSVSFEPIRSKWEIALLPPQIFTEFINKNKVYITKEFSEETIIGNIDTYQRGDDYCLVINKKNSNVSIISLIIDENKTLYINK